MKNWKMSTKISSVVILTLFVALGLLCIVVSNKARGSMETATGQRLTEATEARAELIIQHIEGVMQSAKEFAQAKEVAALLAHPDDKAAAGEGQAYLESFAATQENLEGLFVATYDTKQLEHNITDAIGEYGETDEKRKETMQGWVDGMYESRSGHLGGIMTSPITGRQVIVCYYPVFDEFGQGIGYVGIAVKADGLVKVLDSLEFIGLEHASYYLLDVAQSLYVFAQDTKWINEEVKEESFQEVIAVSNGSKEVRQGSISFRDTDKKASLAVYQSIPQFEWAFVITDTEEEIFSSTNGLTRLVAIICILALVTIAVITVLIVKLVSGDLAKVGRIVNEVAESMDMTKAGQIKGYLGRKDEVGKISEAVYGLTSEITKIVHTLQEKDRGFLKPLTVFRRWLHRQRIK